ncbi:MAG: serine/threonine protein kinase [Labilithrix sp.]|nr:serine/threonine protein kinase [Labilithrix sp.]MCW5817355.1 serine/threonine protein kinase [Labilithrix sp.]
MAAEGKNTALKEWVESKRASVAPPPETAPDPDADPNLAGIPKVGEEILGGKYVIERLMGVGGMGVVCAAMHKQLKQRVAIKFLSATMRSPELVDRFVREGQAAVRIKSEHIAPVLDVGVLDNGTPYLLMEHLSGADLSDYLIEHKRLSVTDAVDFVLQALDALAVAHSAGVVHRDLKPSNLFVTQRSDGSPLIKVLDFGISKVTDAGPNPSSTLTRPGMMLGSPRYMSPEQLRNASGVDHRADIWAMGIVMHELMAGAPPYDADTFTALCAAIVSEEPALLRSAVPDAPAELEAIILKCLAKKTEERWQDVGELAQAIAPFASDDARPFANRITKILGKVSQKTPPGAYQSTKLSPGTPKPNERTLPLAAPTSSPSSSPLATTDPRTSTPPTDPQVSALAVSTAKAAAPSHGRTIAIGAAAVLVLAAVGFIATRKPSEPVTGGATTTTTTTEPEPEPPPTATTAAVAAPTAPEPAVSAEPAPAISSAPAAAAAPAPLVVGTPRPRPSQKPAASTTPSAAPTPAGPSEEDMLNRRR